MTRAKHTDSIERTNRSAYAFKLGPRAGLRSSADKSLFIVKGHLHDKLLDFGGCFGVTRAAVGTAIVLLGYQSSIPSEQRIWGHQGANLEEPFPANRFSLGNDAAALAIREQQALLPSCSRSTRFSSSRYSMRACWQRFTHPAKSNIKN